MAIEFIGSSAVYKGTSLSVVPPSGTQPGDLLLFVVDGSVQSATGLGIGTAPNIYYTIVRAGIDQTGAYTAFSGSLTAVCLVYRGTNGVPKLASSANITATSSATNTAATPTSLGDWLVNIWGTNTTAATLATASGNVRVDVDPTGSFTGLLISDQAPNSTASVAGVTATASAAVIDQQSRVLLEEARVPYSLGSTNLKSTTSLTLDPAHTSEVGDTLFVSFITSAAPTALTVSDSGGNTYTLVASVALNNTAANGTLYLYASYRITNRVLSGFTVTSSNAVLMAISAWGVNAAANLGASQLVSPAVTAFGSSTAPTASKTGLTTTTTYWSFGVVGTNGPSGDTFTQAAGYLTPPVRVGTTGGAATTNRTIAGGWDAFNASTAKNYAPTLGTSRAWGEIFVVYRYGTETSGVTTENIGISATESSTATINYNYVATHGESPGNTYYEYVNSPAQSYVTQIAWDTLRGLGTSFQANTTGPVGRVSLHLVPIGSGVYPGNYAIELYPVSSKTGTVGSLIASSQFSLASITADAIYHFSFEGTGASVTAGQWYVVAIKAPTDSLSTVRYPYVFVSNDQGVEESYYTEQINQSAPFILNNTGTWVYDNTRWPLKVSVYGNTIQDIVNGTTPGIAAPITESATGTDVSTQIKSSIAQHSEATSGVYYDFLNTLAPTAFTSITWGSVRGTGVSFQAKTTGPVGSVSLNLASVGTGAYPSNYTVELYSASSRTGAIGSLIASKEFALQSITTAGVYEFSFEGTGASVTAGQWYLVAIKAPTDSTTSARYLFVSLAGGAPGYEQYSNEQYGQSGVYSFNNSSVWEYDTGFAALKVAVYGTDTTLDSQLGGLTLTSARTETGTVTESPTSSMTLYRGTYEASSGERAADGYTTIKVGDSTTTLTIGGSFRVGMHFIAPSTGRLGKVAIQYGSVPTANTDAVAIELWSLASNSVTASRQTLITQYNTTAANLAAGGNSTYKIIADFSDNSSANVTAGNGYAVVIYQQTANYSDVIGYSTVNNGDYLSQYRTTYGIGIIDTLYALKMGIEYQNTNIETVIGIADQNVSASETGSPTDQVTQSKFSAGIVTESDETAPILTGSFTNSGDFNALTISQNCDGLRFTSSYTGQVGTVKVWMARNSSGTNPTQLGAVKIFNISSVTATTLGTLVAQLPIKFTDFTLNTNGETSEFDFSSVSGATLVSGNSYFIVVVPGDDWVTAGGVNSISRQAYYFNGTNYNIFRNVVAYPARALYTMTTGNSISDLGIYYAPMIVLRAGQGLTETNVGGLTLTSSSTETGTSTESNTVTLDISSFATESSSTSEESTNLVEFNSTATETGTVTESNDQSAYVSRAWITDSNNHTYLDTRNGYSLIGSAIQNKQFSEKAYGFTFQANKSGQVGTVFVNGNRNQNGNPAPLQPLRVTIWNADSVTNLPTTELAGLDVPFTSLPNASYSTIQFNFSSIPAAQLISGNKYAITLEAGSDWDGTLTDSFSLALADNSSGKDYVISAYNGSGLYKSFGSSNFVTNKTIYVLRVTIEEPEITLDTTLGALDTSADVSETGTTNDSSNRAISVLRYSPESTVGQKAVAALDLSIATSFGGGAFSNSFGVGVSFIAPKSGRLGDVRIHTNVNTVANPIPTTLGTVELWQLQSLTGQATSKLAEFSFAFPTTATTTISPALLGSFSNVSGADVVPGTAYAVTVKAGSDWGGSNRNLNFWGVDTPFWNYYTNSVAGTYASVSIFGANDGNNSFNTSRIPVYDVEYATLTVDSLSGTYNPSVTRTEAATANTVTDWVQIDYTPQSVLYWVGGSGTMSGSSSGNWATTSGGSPTFFVPSAITDVYFDGNSDNGTPFTVTIGNTTCKSITVSGLDQPLTMTGAGALICYGGVTLPSSNFTSTYTGSITYRGEGRFNLDYNSNNFGGAVTFGSTTQNDYVSNDTAQILGSNYGLDANNIGNYVYVVGSSVGSYTLDGSTWTQRAAPFGSSSSATINSPTQVLVGSGVGSTIFVLSPTAEPTTATSYVGPASFYSSGTYGNNLYVFIAGSSGTLIYTSSTGTASSWTLRYTSPAVLTDVIWTGSQFIAVGSNGRVVTSSDGITWTDRITTTNTTDSLLAVASNGTTHVAVGNTGRIITSTDGINWTVQSSGTTNNLSEVAYGNNMFVAAGALGSYRYSSDGVTWTPVSVTTSAVNSLFFVNGKFWGVGNTNHTVSSTDGITWTNNTKNVSTIYSIAYNPATNLAVTVGGNGYTHRAYIDSSTSNLNYWTGTIGSTGTTNALNGVAYGAGLYVAVGAAGTIITSPDGITWTPRTSNTSQTLNDIVWSGDKFVAVGNTSAIRTSTDGITWNTASVTGVSSILRVAYNGTLFVAVGGSGNIKTSTDGTTWDTQTAATGFTSTTWQGICWNSDDNIFVIAGTSSSINWSSDGITWNNIESKPSGTVALTALAYYRGLYLAGGTSGLCWSSYDGLNWVARTSQNQNVQNIIGIPNKNRVFFCLSSGELDIGTVNTSSYKIASPTTFSGGITQSVGGIIVNSNLTTASYAIVTNTTQARGLKLQSGVTLDLNSTGTVWSYVTTDSINSFNSTGANILLSDNTTGARAFNGGTKSYDLVTIGGLTSTSNTTFSGTPTFNTLTTNKTVAHTISFNTADITRVANWNIQGTAGNVVSLRRSGTPALTNYILSVPTVGAPSTPYDIIYGQSELVAVGSSGAVRTSYDGINWTTRTSGVSVTLYGVAYNGSNMHVAVGAGGVIITSPDGITWNSRTSGTTNQLNDVCWAGTQFLAVGNTGTIITSPDGITWTTQTISGLTANLLRCGSSGSYHMLGGVGGVLYRGSDITNIAAWTSDSNAGGVNVTEIAYGNGYFVIGIATSSNGNVKYTSNNGTSWLGASTGVGGPTVDKIVWCPAFNGWAAISSGSYIYLCTSSIPSSFGYYSTVRTYSVGYGRNQVVFLTAAATAHLINANYQIVKV